MEVNKPLLNAEEQELEAFLDSEDVSEDALNISSLHGFLTALAVGPTLVPPSQWLPTVWGEEEPIFDSEEDAQRIFSLLLRFYNSIGETLRKKPQKYVPLLFEEGLEDEPYLTAEDWCHGFSLGVGLCTEDWERLFEDDEARNLLAPIIAFTSADAMADVLSGLHGEADRDLLMAALPVSVVAMYEYWRDDRREFSKGFGLDSLPARSAPKVGRNDPCPCGSGKKYKKCCGAAN